MDNLYDLHSWSKHYREDALRDAHGRHLAERAKVSRGLRFARGRMGLAWTSRPSLLRNAEYSK